LALDPLQQNPGKAPWSIWVTKMFLRDLEKNLVSLQKELVGIFSLSGPLYKQLDQSHLFVHMVQMDEQKNRLTY